MKLRMISVGHKMPDWVTQACREYQKRFPRDITLEIIEIKPEKRAAGNSKENIQRLESKRILDAVGKDYCIALDERGKSWTTVQVADQFEHWQTLGRDVCFIIGGADGLHSDVKEWADRLWSLSPLTLPHAMVRVLLAEQLYRAYTVVIQHPYHRA